MNIQTQIKPELEIVFCLVVTNQQNRPNRNRAMLIRRKPKARFFESKLDRNLAGARTVQSLPKYSSIEWRPCVKMRSKNPILTCLYKDNVCDIENLNGANASQR
jgi:hypothetical protein